MTTVLVVEDDAMFAKAVGRDLSDQGFDVTTVHTVQDALERVAEREFDVLLTDLRLGAQDGIDLLAALRDVSPATRAVLMSGYATARDYHRAVELGAVRVLCKPFTPAELIQCIRQAVECQSGFRGSVHGLSFVDMLQMFNFGRRSVTITVGGHSPGRLHLRDGQIIHAEHQGMSGEEAVRSIVAMPAGTLSTTALPIGIALTVTRDFREVLMDALRSMDEAAAHAETAPRAQPATDDDAFDIQFDVHESVLPPSLPALALAETQTLAAREALFPSLLSPSLSEAGRERPPTPAKMLELTREIEGYVASCLVLSSSGAVVCFDGSIDLRPVAPITADIVRRKQQTISDMGMDDAAEDLLITSTNQYHLIRNLQSDLPAFIYLVLDRARSNPALAKIALSNAVRAL